MKNEKRTFVEKMGITLLVIAVMALAVTGCGSYSDEYCSYDYTTDAYGMYDMQDEAAATTAEAEPLARTTGEEKYILTIEIKQSHFTLDLETHLKDSLNEVEITIPVDKDYYDSVNVGDRLTDEFRWGSLILKGSIGNWKVTVKDKTIGYFEEQ